MTIDTGKVYRLEDYRTSDYAIRATHLVFRLDPRHARVTATLSVERREDTAFDAPLVLDGDGLKLLSVALDGTRLTAQDYSAAPDQLTVARLPKGPFTLVIETELAPEANSALMGLYLSNGVYCTQCEAEGFRRITYFLDRPDVMSVYTVRIEAPKATAPILLSNGNPVESGDLEDGWHYAVWHDPHLKPSYLFALVAGDLGKITDGFTTRSGRAVELGIYVEKGKEARAAYAMDALKRSMHWDEDVFGLEYDLDVFNIVAVSDFNMGAMENKGLNIFNDKYVLADEETATDADFANIEAIIAHEYFHNWTGNRITCRDWFQLCLKEGLTVFRDHEFSADMRSRAVKRIAEVRTLKSLQFPEDQGPLAHPVRPRRYREINNFYTATVYEKGSEVVRMIRTILGADTFRRGMDLYFERHDGDAATIEDFLKVFEDVSGRDLSQFALWYHQAGTPHVSISAAYDEARGELTLDIEQSVPPTPSESRKRLMHIPLAIGLVGQDGSDLEAVSADGSFVDGLIHLKKRRQVVRFAGLSQRPAVSLNRGFSAPVTLASEQSVDDRLFLARHDSDLVARWQALNGLLCDYLIETSKTPVRQSNMTGRLAEVLGAIAADDTLEPAYRALALTPPSEADVAREIGSNIDPDAIHDARDALIDAIAAANRQSFEALYGELEDTDSFSSDAQSAGRRALRNVLLDYASAARRTPELAAGQYCQATNMTERAAALAVLAHRFASEPLSVSALADFETRHADNPLVLDKWFQIQATIPGDAALSRVEKLTRHGAFSIGNPNRVRSLIGTFASSNQTGFHRADGAGYRFFADRIIEVEKRNPQVAARLATAFRSWRSLEPGRQELARVELARIVAVPGLSTDLKDIVDRTLA
ncbi:aminopeptidase N [Mesorhizobium sp. YIM 152430]|uniref:aminopeptidase N n=1 Tax=Mesorhizobium sp. YIM 152430 TaxID=3031761 RepID=UPI0023DBFDC9|nr:aminopeptidase N [Mesorhizobium sp. YIM 152430]MDF1601347.1 aminopeptidase N [Mesorhizobium sp. YIM 152430]